jgi:hypothetical protein
VHVFAHILAADLESSLRLLKESCRRMNLTYALILVVVALVALVALVEL